MHLGLLPQERLTFDPLKPIILRGPPTEDGTSVFSGNVLLSLARNTKVSSISVTLKCTATTYWPEGIGARGTRLSHEKVLSEQTVQVLSFKDDKKKGYTKLPPGIHRFAFVFVIPNSIVETIEDVYGRVRHTVEARTVGPGVPLLNNWHTTKQVLVLRAYMSNSLLTNNSLEDLSRTFEKHVVTGDVQVVVEAVAFSSGDIFHLRCVIQPHRKRARLEHMELFITEHRRYNVPEVRAHRSESDHFPLTYIGSSCIVDGEISRDTTEELRPVFSKHNHGIELTDTMAYRITFATPTCMRNIHHTTYYKEILFRHHLAINLVVSYVDDTYKSNTPSPSSSTTDLSPPLSPHESTVTLSSGSSHGQVQSHSNGAERPSMGHTGSSHSNARWLARLRKTKADKDFDDTLGHRLREKIQLETLVTVFDCRLKEDFGRLPSYFELGVTKSVPTCDSKEMHHVDDTLMGSSSAAVVATSSLENHVFLCSCFHAFRKQMQLASATFFLPDDNAMIPLDRIPSKPPPDYVDSS
ncbi:uncharacterized protein BYT42DRAFT_594175 [Radiomyces spectabilis]|uniref:uncharacterized protein n=1 Tax=Radiomyces spectabilis TaxID=64574 RepID=UPI00221EB6F8|nr:uncharacterized protein BYT42DRAFT_594175 [Radiomyces spectabilis]KAI8376153.1 hypothetical protein BYT42DRAFT_594175 [Radiomyces spectabilis]